MYVGCLDKNIYAFNASTGKSLWKSTTGNIITASPTFINGVVYIGSYDANVNALDASSGLQLWSYATGDLVAITAAVANGVVYVGSDAVYAIKAQSPNAGTLLWKYSADGSLLSGSPAVANNTVFVGASNGTFYSSLHPDPRLRVSP